MSAQPLMELFESLRQRIEANDWGEAQRLMQKCDGLLHEAQWTPETLAEARRLHALCTESAQVRGEAIRDAVVRSAGGSRARRAYGRAMKFSPRR